MLGSIGMLNQGLGMENHQSGELNSLEERLQGLSGTEAASSFRISGDDPAAGESGGIDKKELKKLTNQMEGLLINELLKQMRKTIPESKLTGGGYGGEVFRSHLDQKYSDIVASNSELGLSEDIYNSMLHRFPDG